MAAVPIGDPDRVTPVVVFTPTVTAGQSVPPDACRTAGTDAPDGREARCPELSEESVKEAPLPAVEGAAKGSAIALGSKASKGTTAITTTEAIQEIQV